MSLPLSLVSLSFLALAVTAPVEDERPAAAASAPKVEIPFHGNERCPMMDKPVKRNKYAQKDGERVYVCCSKCRRKAKLDFATARDAAYPKDQVIDLENERCPIGGEKVDGETSMVFQSYRIRLCCPGCEEDFRKDPRKHLTLLLNPDVVPLNNERCPVMPEEPSSRDDFFVYDGVLIDTCCGDCPEMFQEDPAKYLERAGIDLAKVKAAAKANREQPKDSPEDG